jgi:hypothetical protein
VSDLNRLGKRGAYRLGRLGAPPPAPVGPPAPHYPSWVPGHRGPGLLWLLGSLAAAVLIALGAAAGWWFLPFTAGLAGGAAARYGRWRLRVALPAAALVAAIGWAIPLGWQALHGAPVRSRRWPGCRRTPRSRSWPPWWSPSSRPWPACG